MGTRETSQEKDTVVFRRGSRRVKSLRHAGAKGLHGGIDITGEEIHCLVTLELTNFTDLA